MCFDLFLEYIYLNVELFIEKKNFILLLQKFRKKKMLIVDFIVNCMLSKMSFCQEYEFYDIRLQCVVVIFIYIDGMQER